MGRLWRAATRRLGFARRLKYALESIVTVAAVIALGLAAWHHFAPDNPTPAVGEGKRVVAFRQVANRICTENTLNMKAAQRQSGTKVEQMGSVARVLGWDLNDLEAITAPPVKFDGFLTEVSIRQLLRNELLALQQAIELGDRKAEASAIGELERLNIESRETSREVGIVRCTKAIPDPADLLGWPVQEGQNG